MNILFGNDRRLYKAIARGENSPEFWSSLDSVRIERLRSHAMEVIALAYVSAVIAFAAAIALVMVYDTPTCLIAFPLAAFAIVIGFDAKVVVGHLMPVAQNEDECAKIVEWLMTPAVRAFRDQVVGNARELVHGDFEAMACLERKFGAAAQKRQALCREAHGLLSDAAAPAATSAVN